MAHRTKKVAKKEEAKLRLSKKVIILPSILFLLLSSGCWNSQELNKLAIVAAGGINFDDQKEDLTFVYQIVNPNATSSMGGVGTSKTPFFTMQTSGKTLFEAIRISTSEISRRLYFGHMQVFVINEKFARERGIKDVLDLLYRDHELREDIIVFIGTETNTDVLLSTQTIIENISGIAIKDHVDNAFQNYGSTRPVELREAITTLTSDTASLTLPTVHLSPPIQKSTLETTQNSKQESIIRAEGFAVFKEDKLIGFLESMEAHCLNFITNDLKKTIIVVSVDGGNHSIEVLHSESKITTSFKNGKPEVLVDIQIEGNIGEINAPIDIMDLKNVRAFETATNQVMNEHITKLIKKVQKEYKVDIFHFGEILERQHFQEFSKIKEDWDKEFVDLAVKVKINTTIRGIGMKNQPFQKEMKGAKK